MITRFRQLPFAAFLALALLFGQFIATQHALGHASRAVSGHEQPGTPLEKTCDTHFNCSQLGSAAGSTAPIIALPEPAALPQGFFTASAVAQAARLAYRSRAPPAA